MTFLKKLLGPPTAPSAVPEDGKGTHVKVVFADAEEKPLELRAAYCAPTEGFFQIIETTYPYFRAVYIPALQIKAIYVDRKVVDKGEKREGNPGS